MNLWKDWRYGIPDRFGDRPVEEWLLSKCLPVDTHFSPHIFTWFLPDGYCPPCQKKKKRLGRLLDISYLTDTRAQPSEIVSDFVVYTQTHCVLISRSLRHTSKKNFQIEVSLISQGKWKNMGKKGQNDWLKIKKNGDGSSLKNLTVWWRRKA